MTDNAKYIISRLLALRAGLSLASKERDELVQAKEKFLLDDKEYQDHLDALHKAEDEIKNCKRDIEGERYLLRKRSKRRNLLALLLLVFVVGGLIVSAMDGLRIVGYLICALGIIIPIVVSYVLVPRSKNYKKPNRRLIRDLTKEINKLNKSIKHHNAALKELYPQHERFDATYQNEKTLRVMNVKDIYNCLCEHNKSLIPTEYWQYSDIMFYYFETEKCEEMDKCLALVNRLTESQYLESSAEKALHNLKARFAKLVAGSKFFLGQEFAIFALKIERSSTNFSGLVENNALYDILKEKLDLSSRSLYEDIMQMINL